MPRMDLSHFRKAISRPNAHFMVSKQQCKFADHWEPKHMIKTKENGASVYFGFQRKRL